MWYGLRVGLTYTQTMNIPFGELLDYVCIEQIKIEGFRRKYALTDEDIIPDVK